MGNIDGFKSGIVKAFFEHFVAEIGGIFPNEVKRIYSSHKVTLYNLLLRRPIGGNGAAGRLFLHIILYYYNIYVNKSFRLLTTFPSITASRAVSSAFPTSSPRSPALIRSFPLILRSQIFVHSLFSSISLSHKSVLSLSFSMFLYASLKAPRSLFLIIKSVLTS